MNQMVVILMVIDLMMVNDLMVILYVDCFLPIMVKSVMMISVSVVMIVFDLYFVVLHNNRIL